LSLFASIGLIVVLLATDLVPVNGQSNEVAEVIRPGGLAAFAEALTNRLSYVPGELLVRFKPDATGTQQSSVTTRALDLIGGWRFPVGRVIPYVGAGMSYVSYEETAPFAIDGDDVSDSSTGAAFLGGVEVSVTRLLRVGGEFGYRAVNGVLGMGGVSSAFGEDQLGGFAAALRVSVGL
jgi:opacity protein-like surface antigen